jgi:hypothetical protein
MSAVAVAMVWGAVAAGSWASPKRRRGLARRETGKGRSAGEGGRQGAAINGRGTPREPIS